MNGKGCYMNNKKQKFFESLSVQLNSYIEAEKVIDQFISNDMDAFQGKRLFQHALGNTDSDMEAVFDRMVKAYKDAAGYGYGVRAFGLMKSMHDHLTNLFNEFSSYQDEKMPDEMNLVWDLCKAGALEVSKVLEYTKGFEENNLKAEARCLKIHNFKSRGDEAVRDSLEAVYGMNNSIDIIYWKDVLKEMNGFLSDIDQFTISLQKLLAME